MPPHTGTGHTGKENGMSKICVEHADNKVSFDIEGTGKELIALFAMIHEDLRKKFKDAGMVEAFDCLVNHIIEVNKGG